MVDKASTFRLARFIHGAARDVLNSNLVADVIDVAEAVSDRWDNTFPKIITVQEEQPKKELVQQAEKKM